MVTNFSIVPAQLSSVIGISFAFLGFVFGSFFILKKLFFGIQIPGFAAIFAAVAIFSGIQLLTIGILGEYISRIHINISERPQYAIMDIVNFKSDESSYKES